MPYIKVSGVEKEKLCRMSKDLIDIVEKDIGVPRERIRLFYSPDMEIRDGKEEEGKVIVNVDWMPRPQELCDKMAELYKEYFFKAGYKSLKMYFTEFVKEKYYLYE